MTARVAAGPQPGYPVGQPEKKISIIDEDLD